MSTLQIEQIPVLNDNYVYVLRCRQTGATAVVDPAVVDPVVDKLTDMGLKKLDYILNTHHHADHTGGNTDLKQKYGCTIIGPAPDQERIPGIDKAVDEGDEVFVGHCRANVMFVPGHTKGHIAFYFPQSEALFCGDTLFAGGCGRLFEGTPTQMFDSLAKIAALPDSTKIYCAHEYTKANYTFAHKERPDDIAVTKRLQEVEHMRAKGQPTVPSLLAEEKASNVFLKARSAEEFAALRQAKDAF